MELGWKAHLETAPKAGNKVLAFNSADAKNALAEGFYDKMISAYRASQSNGGRAGFTHLKFDSCWTWERNSAEVQFR